MRDRVAVQIDDARAVRERVGVQLDDSIAFPRDGVEDDQRVARRVDAVCDCASGVPDHPGGQLLDAGVVPHGVLLGLAGNRAGQNVVLLVDQQQVPRLVEGLAGVGAARQQAGHGGVELAVVEGDLALPVAALDDALGRVGAPVQLKVELVGPDVVRPRLERALQPLHVPLHRAVFQGDGRAELPYPAARLEHLRGGAAAAVPVAVCEQHPVGLVLLLVHVPRLGQGRGVELGVARGGPAVAAGGPGGKLVGDDRAPVDSLPNEGVVREAVELVPGHLVGQEVLQPAAPQELGKRPRVAEGVHYDQGVAATAELALEVAEAEGELAHQGLAGRHVAVGLGPHRAVHLPAALGDSMAHGLVQLREVPAEIVVDLPLVLHEGELGVPLHQVEDGGHRAPDLEPVYVEGPEPCQVYMGLPDGDGRRRGRAESRFIQLEPQLLGGGRDRLVEGIAARLTEVDLDDSLVEGAQDTNPVHRVLRQRERDVVCRGGVPVERLRRPIDQLDLGVGVQVGVRPDGGGLPVGLLEVGLPEHVEGNEILASALGLLGDRYVVVVGVEPLHQLAVDERQRLGVEEGVEVAAYLEGEGHRAALEALRHSDPCAEPAWGVGAVPGLQGVPARIVQRGGRAVVRVAAVYSPAGDLHAVPDDRSPDLFDSLLESWDDVPEVGDHGSSGVSRRME